MFNILAGLVLSLIAFSAVAAEANTPEAVKTITRILGEGAETGVLPPDFQVRVYTIGYPRKDTGKTEAIYEGWQFERGMVQRLDKRSIPVENAPWEDAAKLCRFLLAADLPALVSAPGGGSTRGKMELLGVPCAGGEQSISVRGGGQLIQIRGESCYAGRLVNEADLKSFRALYVQLWARAQRTMLLHQTLWGEPVQGLQLGIVAEGGEQDEAGPLCLRTVLRAVGDQPVEVIAPIYTCLLGEGEPMMLSHLELTPQGEGGGPAIPLVYRGWNHLSLRDTRREKGQQPQETLNRNLGPVEIQLNAKDVALYQKTIKPGEDGWMETVTFGLGAGKPKSFWVLEKGQSCKPGPYDLRAVFQTKCPQSPWQGTLTSAPLLVEVTGQEDEDVHVRVVQPDDAHVVEHYLKQGAQGKTLPTSFTVDLDMKTVRFQDTAALCRALLEADFVGMWASPRDATKKRMPENEPLHEIDIRVQGRGIVILDEFCQASFADDAVTRRFRALCAKLAGMIGPPLDAAAQPAPGR